jgi:hypothetical protein
MKIKVTSCLGSGDLVDVTIGKIYNASREFVHLRYVIICDDVGEDQILFEEEFEVIEE